VVRIVTDSVSDIPGEVAEQLRITVVPLYVRFGSEVYRDGVELSNGDFYRKLVISRRLPTTSAPSPRDFSMTYDRLAEETDEILSIHVSSKFSTVHKAAQVGRERMKRKCRVEVVDSLTGAMGEGLIVIAAARWALEGVMLDELADMVRKAAHRVHVYMCFETLEYLNRGGRIGRAESMLGSPLKVNSIIGLEDGEIQPICRERRRSRAIERLYGFARKFDNATSLAVEHGAAVEDAETLAERLVTSFTKERMYLSTISSVVGVHTGPNVIGLSVLEG
jgi:DegV family protein with EDD domain